MADCPPRTFYLVQSIPLGCLRVWGKKDFAFAFGVARRLPALALWLPMSLSVLLCGDLFLSWRFVPRAAASSPLLQLGYRGPLWTGSGVVVLLCWFYHRKHGGFLCLESALPRLVSPFHVSIAERVTSDGKLCLAVLRNV